MTYCHICIVYLKSASKDFELDISVGLEAGLNLPYLRFNKISIVDNPNPIRI